MNYKNLKESNDFQFALVPILPHPRKNISASARMLYGMMLTHSIDYKITVHINTLADAMCLCERQIRRQITELSKNGMLEVRRTITGNTYKLNPFYGE